MIVLCTNTVAAPPGLASGSTRGMADRNWPRVVAEMGVSLAMLSIILEAIAHRLLEEPHRAEQVAHGGAASMAAAINERASVPSAF